MSEEEDGVSIKHIYMSGLVVVLTGALLTAFSNIYARMLRTEERMGARITKIEKVMLDKDFLDQRFSAFDYRLDLFRKNCCSYLTEKELNDIQKGD